LHLNPINRNGLKRKVEKKLSLRNPNRDRNKSSKHVKSLNNGYNGNGNESYVSYPNETSNYNYEEDYKDYNNINTVVDDEVYCICQKVTQELEMIQCDNDNCKYKWFHFSCVGIEVAPEGKWFCSDCLKSKQKKKKK
jgi:hypothetical protein